MSQGAPASILRDQFVSHFADEAWCIRYLCLLRWPDHFTCPRCGNNQNLRSPAALMTCHRCGKATSITGETLLHGTKRPLSQWLRLIWQFCDPVLSHEPVATIQDHLELGSYQATWTVRRTIRRAMACANRRTCAGTVEIDSTYLPFNQETATGCYLAAAVEVDPTSRVSGRVRISPLNQHAQGSIQDFIDTAIEPGSIILVPDTTPFRLLSHTDYLYLPEFGSTRQEHARGTLQRFTRIFSKQRGPKRTSAHLQDDLDEFVFRTNSELLGNRKAVFEHLLNSLLHHRPRFRQQDTAKLCSDGGRA